MHIESLAVRLPTRIIDNDELLHLVRAANTKLDATVVERYCRTLGALLEKAGAVSRRYRDRQAGETAIDLIVDAVNAAIREAQRSPREVDLIIYCGVGRGFLEPANAAFVASAVGLTCDAFDVSDACMSWVRALHITHSFLATRTYSAVLIVNGEFTVYEHGLPDVLEIRSPDQLRYVFPAFTIGEAASATLLSRSSKPWRFVFRSRPDLADLCSVALPGFREFSPSDCEERLGISGVHQLVSFGQELGTHGLREITKLLRDSIPDLDAIDLFFPHAATEQWCLDGQADLQLNGRVVSGVFPRHGNLISASIPAAMRLAADEQRLHRGQRIVLCPASAGMSFAVVELEY